MMPSLLPEPVAAPGPFGPAGKTSWPTLLVVDADEALARTLVCHFERRGFHVAAAGTLAEAQAFLERRKDWTLVIADCHLPDGTVWELEPWLKQQSPRPPLLLLSQNPRMVPEHTEAGFLLKPISLARIEASVNRLTLK